MTREEYMIRRYRIIDNYPEGYIRDAEWLSLLEDAVLYLLE